VKLDQAKKDYEQMRADARQDENVQEEPDEVNKPEDDVNDLEDVITEPEQKPKEEPAEEPYVSKVDFASLQQQNEDIYAWLEIPGTVIDYPILQHPTDLEYYLNYTVQRVEGLPGSIYTEYFNNKDFKDFNTVVYGHNMRNGTMFKGLHKYAESSFLQENPYVNIYLPDRTLTYQIFATGEWDDFHILERFGFFATESDKQAFLTELEAIWQNHDLEVTTASQIITLATCMGNQPENRWIVVAVLIEES
jgi:sortase B